MQLQAEGDLMKMSWVKVRESLTCWERLESGEKGSPYDEEKANNPRDLNSGHFEELKNNCRVTFDFSTIEQQQQNSTQLVSLSIYIYVYVCVCEVQLCVCVSVVLLDLLKTKWTNLLFLINKIKNHFICSTLSYVDGI